MRDITVSAVQFGHAAGNKQASLEKIQRFVLRASRQDVEIVVFPECCITGYWFLRKLASAELRALAEPVPNGPSSPALLSMARESGMTIGAGLVEIDAQGELHNTYLVAMPDGQWQLHRKIHAFEHQEIIPGTQFTVFDTPHGCRVGVLTCYDVNINENVRIEALRGAEILLAPHQTGGVASKNPHLLGRIDPGLWENRHANPEAIESEFRGEKGRAWLMRWLPARAHDNGLFLIFSNGVGIDDDEVRTGNAMILDPYGGILAETWKADDEMVVTRLDASLLEHSTGRRWITTRRPELYTQLTVPTGRERETSVLSHN